MFVHSNTYFMLQGWGFCHENCLGQRMNEDIYGKELKMVKSTIFKDSPTCKKRGLCAGFVNHMNVTIMQNLKG